MAHKESQMPATALLWKNFADMAGGFASPGMLVRTGSGTFKCAPSPLKAEAPAADAASSAAGAVDVVFATKGTIKGGWLKAGSVVRVRATGAQTANAGASLTGFTLKIGGVVIGLATTPLAGAVGNTFDIKGEAIFNAGLTAFNGCLDSFWGVPGTSASDHSTNHASALATAGDVDVTLTANFGVNAGDTVRLETFTVEVIG